ncbi:MAG: MarR family transcriptional regulator [Kiritimatiellaceae bacterium]|nr:MarR family transcriptional regulator [Kiritimatiellaceae bacterium]
MTSLNTFADEMQRIMPFFMGAMLRRERNAISQGIITVPQFLGLSFLRTTPEATVKDFAATLGLKLSSASGLLDRMEKQGLLKRTHSTEDRRVVNLTLTAKGKKMVDQIMQQKRNSIAEIYSVFSPQERETYLTMMQKVMKHIQ